MSLIGDLYRLQELDSALDAAVATLESVRARMGENDAASEVQIELAEATAGLGDLETRARDLEMQVGSLRDKATPVETKLYSGSTHNPKELADLERDLEQITRQRAAREDELLALMEQIEARRAAARDAERRLRACEAAWSAEQASLNAEAAVLDTEVSALRERRDHYAATIPAPAVTSYNRLRQRRKGVAVVRVERNICQGCRLTVPTMVLQRARSGTNTTPAPCPSCERLLFVL